MMSLRLAVRKSALRPTVARAYATSPHQHGGDPETIQKEKEKSIKGENESSVGGAPGWNEQLASESEAKVKATKDARGPEELQAETSKAKEVEHPHGEAGDLRTGTGNATPPKNV